MKEQALEVINHYMAIEWEDVYFNVGVDKTGTIYALYDYDQGDNMVFDLKDDEDCKELIKTLTDVIRPYDTIY